MRLKSCSLIFLAVLVIVIGGCTTQETSPSEGVVQETEVEQSQEALASEGIKEDTEYLEPNIFEHEIEDRDTDSEVSAAFYDFESSLENLANQGHGIGDDHYDRLLDEFKEFEKQGFDDGDIERVRIKLLALEPAKKVKRGLLNAQGCEGSGSFKLSASPIDLENLEKIRPMGGLSSSHITPTDHQYWDTIESDGYTDDTTNLDRFNIYAPADGYVIDVEKGSDHRIVIEHTCNFYTIFIHVDRLSEKIISATGFDYSTTEREHEWPRVKVNAGELIGTVGVGKFDFSVIDEAVTLPGLIVPESYLGEIWKIHTVDTFDYFELRVGC